MADEKTPGETPAPKDNASPPVPPPSSTEPELAKAAWGAPFAKIDHAWTTLESRLCTAVLIAEVGTILFWIAIRAMSSTGRGGPGLIFRMLVAALLFGVVTRALTKKHRHSELFSTAAVLASIPITILFGNKAGDLGTAYFSNLFAWLQNASILVFFGGVNELAKRFTLWLALLGASLATAQGKHINVDVMMRFFSPKARVRVAILGWVAAGVVSIIASWGFFEYVAVEELNSPPTIACPGDATKRCPSPPSSKIETVSAIASRDLFLAGRQVSLDLQSLPKVILGTPYNTWLKPHAWNEWLRAGNWESRFKAEDVKAFELPEDGSVEFRNPSVTAIPGGTQAIQKLLVPLMNLVFSFGLFVIGIRFFLRSLLALAGWIKVDPGAAHGDEELAHAHDHSPEAELAEAKMKETHT